ncbi:hypothetical protein MHBO_004932 [Bonamia ostreae]|uniref:Uncharacterized protein n=1 Tax=Bonamia ostreae TaxID=126728 RepID=A0ABV2AUP2_9EUKA
MGGTSDLSSDIITKIRKMHDDFAILLRVTKERVEAETSKLKSKENLCKNYAKEIKNALEKMKKMLIESATMQKSKDDFCF